jgi:hypothetical protein
MTGSHSRSSTWITAPSSAICTALRLRKAPPAAGADQATGGRRLERGRRPLQAREIEGVSAALLEHPLSSGGA